MTIVISSTAVAIIGFAFLILTYGPILWEIAKWLATVLASIAFVRILAYNMARAQDYNDPAPIVGAPLPYAPPPPPYQRYQSQQQPQHDIQPYYDHAPMYGGMFGHR